LIILTSKTIFLKGSKKKKGHCFGPLKGVLVLIADEIIYAGSKSTVI